ncbi:hypothetical protein D3869_32765 (plasmid) [Azospirillum brasilense]|uniref:Uncharacterized protein n=1 Tax=Azospirillum brasilense TaxID=192 RepID=A0A4D8RFU4_AZOBR|nr:hypothetical protein D3869_32765 [Azospirillum brasilense]
MIAGAGTVGKRLIDGPYVEEAMALIKRLEPDSYSEFLVDFLTQGRRRFGSNWMYADIVTVLLGLCDILQPATYLEIGVRRGGACVLSPPNIRNAD